VLVGPETSDDAAVYRITGELGLVLTIDYFTPIVDDPYSYGLIAAANSLSDVYAMGARPLTMLNIVGIPKERLAENILARMLQGGVDKAKDAGVEIIGGHTIDDKEPKFGFAVTGLVHPDRIYRNVGAKPGDVLVLTKPLGSGIISTAIKNGKAPETLIQKVVEVMATLNKGAAEAMVEIGASACTDVTGFGLLGHLYEMTSGSGVGARISLREIPIIPEVFELAREGYVPGGSKSNLQYLEKSIVWDSTPEEAKIVLADAQTSGGLLISIPGDKVDSLRQALTTRGVNPVAFIGEIIPDSKGRIWVTD
jgi:selenide,water dikinase